MPMKRPHLFFLIAGRKYITIRISKLRATGLLEKVPGSRRYRWVGKGYSICVAFLQLFEKIYAPLTAGLLAPCRGDGLLREEKRCEPDRLYQRICDPWTPSCALSVSK